MCRFAMFGKWVGLFAAFAFAAAAHAADGVAAKAKPAAEKLRSGQVEALFSPGLSAEARAAATRAVVAAAQGGDGYAAFYLGVLHRHGKAHPAGVEERNADSARYWLERCVGSPQCPRTALDSLAELELVEGNHKAAMQWAQASALLGRELVRLQGKPDRDIAGYTGYLLKRNYEYLPKANRDALVRAWFDEFLVGRAKQLDRMLAHAWKIDKLDTSAIANKHQAAQINRLPRKPSLGVYLLRMAPEGGRPESVVLIEGLPAPADVLGLEGVARRFETHPYVPDTVNARDYVRVPVVFQARY